MSYLPPLSITGIKVDLPQVKARGTSVDEDRIVLSINSDGAYFFEKTKIATVNLEDKLKAVFEFRNKKELYIRADESVEYGKVVFAMSAAKMAGVTRMAMLTKPSKKSH